MTTTAIMITTTMIPATMIHELLPDSHVVVVVVVVGCAITAARVTAMFVPVRAEAGTVPQTTSPVTVMFVIDTQAVPFQ